MTKPLDIIIKALNEIGTGKPGDRVAKKYKIHPVTLQRWLKRYRKNGRGDYTVASTYQRPHNRLPAAIEEKIYLRKEQEPGITLESAQKKLRRDGVNVCLATIRRVWRDYGFLDNPMNRPPDELAIPIESRQILQKARQAADQLEAFSDAARLLNRMKVCPDLKLLEKIPDRFLNIRHRLQKLDAMRNIETMPVFYRRARRVRQCLERKKYYYSMLQAGFVEASALSWLEHPEKGLDLINHLVRATPGRLNRYLRFRLTYYRGRYLADMLRTEEALVCARQCENLIKSLKQYDLAIKLSQLYSSLGYYRKAKTVLEKAWNRYKPKISDEDRISHAVYSAINGEYHSARSMIKKLTNIDEKYRPLYYVTRAYCEIGAGNLERAQELNQQALARARREGFLNILQASIIVQACVYSALGFKREAIKVIKKIMPLLARRKVKRDYYIHAIFAGETRISDKCLSFPPIKLLLNLLKAGQTGRSGDYNEVYRFAESRGLLGIFHRYCLLAPEIVIKLQKKARPTRLPRPILDLPLFNKDLPNIRLDLLGTINIFREDKPMKIRLRPKDAAFLIHLLTARNARLEVQDCLTNFWPRTRAPKNNLYHLLRRLRYRLQIPPQNLYVRRNVIHYAGTTISDYNIFQESLSLAQNLDRAGEWAYANREYQNAFQLFRGEPFRRLFDPWSDDIRNRILAQLEAAAINYADRCRANGNIRDGTEILEKTLLIIPGSEGCRQRLSSPSSTALPDPSG